MGELWRIAWYFTEAGAFVFGSGLAIVPFLHGGVVDDFHWLDERQFLDAVAPTCWQGAPSSTSPPPPFAWWSSRCWSRPAGFPSR
jgi:chromate transporter